MRILIPTDVLPPHGKGGAAWSTHTLARALQERGHQVTAIVPQRGRSGITHADALGIPTIYVGYRAPNIPFVQNYVRHEWFRPRLAAAIIAAAQQGPPVDLIHAQHVQTIPAAVLAGRSLHVPVVATVRDHWPWDYFATGLHAERLPYPHNSAASLLTDLVARRGPLWGLLAAPAIPYMLAHVRQRAKLLSQADAVIACSTYIAARLRSIVADERLHVIPHMVDFAAVERAATANQPDPSPLPLLLFAGKLEPNKGAGLLPAIFTALRTQGPLPPLRLIIAGDGALRSYLAHELAALEVPTEFLDWAGHDRVLALMARCDLLLFPSAWGEPLSRVLLEASALGAPILAMPTGGTGDIVQDGKTGALAATPQTFAARIRELLADPQQRRQLGENARSAARARYAVEIVAPHYETLYRACRKA
ncbi:MAG: glycosyltransferase family 4 protein [Oscillochloris sp.]|nr:glycosyltransferase family 4 protein [Oscillochloris sp.]